MCFCVTHKQQLTLVLKKLNQTSGMVVFQDVLVGIQTS